MIKQNVQLQGNGSFEDKQGKLVTKYISKYV